MKITGNEPALPRTVYYDEVPVDQTTGITIRQKIAAQFMQAFLTNHPRSEYSADFFEAAATDSIQATDALINALNESEG